MRCILLGFFFVLLRGWVRGGGGGGGGKTMYSVVAFGDFGKVYTLYLISYIVSYFYMCKNLTKTMNIY